MIVNIFIFTLLSLSATSFRTDVVTGTNEEYQGQQIEDELIRNAEEHTFAINKTTDARDKRALGLVLQGLVGALGYSPPIVQFGTLPSATMNNVPSYVGLIGRVPATAGTPEPPITYPPGSSIPLTNPPLPLLTYPPDLLLPAPSRPPAVPTQKPPAAPTQQPPAVPTQQPVQPPLCPPASGLPKPLPPSRFPQLMPPLGPAKPPAPANCQRRKQTLKLTGFINFGNTSDPLGHLQQYERLFHGPQNMTAPAPSPPTNIRFPDSKPTLLPPFLVRIPLPIAPNLPPPLLPAPNLDNSNYENEGSLENYSVESKEDGPEIVKTVPPKAYSFYNYKKNPHRMQSYKDRLVELERQKEAEAEKTVNNYENDEDDEDEKQHSERQNSEKDSDEQGREEDGSAEITDESRDNDSSQQYQGRKLKTSRYEESDERNKENEDGGEEYNDESETARKNEASDESNRNGYLYSIEKLPVSFDRERMRPSVVLRNSYGDNLENGNSDERVASYFPMFKNRKSNDRIDNYGSKKSQKYVSPDSRSKYEEYNLEREREPESEDDSNKDDHENAEATKITYVEKRPAKKLYVKKSSKGQLHENVDRKIPKNLNTDEHSRLRTEETTKIVRNVSKIPTYEPFDFVKYVPYYLPVQYQYEPVTYEKILHGIQQDTDSEMENGRVAEITGKDNSEPVVGLPSYHTNEKLNKESVKEFRGSPPPSDHTFGNTEQSVSYADNAPDDYDDSEEMTSNVSNLHFKMTYPERPVDPPKLGIKGHVSIRHPRVSSSEEEAEPSDELQDKEHLPESRVDKSYFRDGDYDTAMNYGEIDRAKIIQTRSFLFPKRKQEEGGNIYIGEVRDESLYADEKNEHVGNTKNAVPNRREFSSYKYTAPENYSPVSNSSVKWLNYKPVHRSDDTDHSAEISEEMRNLYDSNDGEHATRGNDGKESAVNTAIIEAQITQPLDDYSSTNKEGLEISDDTSETRIIRVKSQEADNNKYYDEGLMDFGKNDEIPEDEVKVKEYKNQIATIKFLEKKRLEPDGKIQVMEYNHKMQHRIDKKCNKKTACGTMEGNQNLKDRRPDN